MGVDDTPRGRLAWHAAARGRVRMHMHMHMPYSWANQAPCQLAPCWCWRPPCRRTVTVKQSPSQFRCKRVTPAPARSEERGLGPRVARALERARRHPRDSLFRVSALFFRKCMFHPMRSSEGPVPPPTGERVPGSRFYERAAIATTTHSHLVLLCVALLLLHTRGLGCGQCQQAT